MLARDLANLDVVNIGAAGNFVIRNPVTQARLRVELARRLPFDSEIMIYRGTDILRLMSLRLSGVVAKPHFERMPLCIFGQHLRRSVAGIDGKRHQTDLPR